MRAVVLMLLCLLAAPAHAAALPDYAGTWEGTMSIAPAYVLEHTIPLEQRYRIVIGADKARVVLLGDGGAASDLPLSRLDMNSDYPILVWPADTAGAVEGWCLGLKGKDTLMVLQVYVDGRHRATCKDNFSYHGMLNRVPE